MGILYFISAVYIRQWGWGALRFFSGDCIQELGVFHFSKYIYIYENGDALVFFHFSMCIFKRMVCFTFFQVHT